MEFNARDLDNPGTLEIDESLDLISDGVVVKKLAPGEGSVAGSGTYTPFLRQNATGQDQSSQGFNTDDGAATANNNSGGLDMDSAFTQALVLGDLPVIFIDLTDDGIDNPLAYYELRLDINEENNAGTDGSGAPNRELAVTELQLYTSENMATLADYNAGTYETRALDDDFALRYDLDETGDNTILLRDTNSGSGEDDYIFYIPVTHFEDADASHYFTLFSQFGPNPDEGATFEEWRIRNTTQIQGFKFNDLDGDGVYDEADGETGLGDFQFYIDSNGDDMYNVGELTTTSAGDGSFTFYGLIAGTYTIREVDNADWELTTGTNGDHLVEITQDDINSETDVFLQVGNFLPNPELSIIKTGTTTGGEDCIDVVGEDIVWTIQVTRAGNVDLENVVVTDDRVDGGATALVRDDALSTGDDDDILEEGETWVYTFTESVDQALINTGLTVTNTAYANATAVGYGTAADQVDDDASLDVCQDPVIQIVKEGTTSDGEDCIDVLGEDIVWTIEVTRAGNVDLENVVVTDDRVDGGATALVRDDALSTGDDDDILEAGETWVYTFTEQATQAMINAGTTVINTAYANGDAVGTGAAATQVDDDATLDVCQDPVIQIVKEGTTSDGEDCIDVVGEDIVWTIEVTRAGNVDLENVVVTDDRVDGGATALVRDDALSTGDDDDILEEGETWVYTFTEQATQAMINAGTTVINTAYANGDAVGTGAAATQVDDDASLDVCQDPVIQIVKEGTTSDGEDCIDVVGEDIVWTIEVTRAGNVDLENVVVTDDRVDGGATALVRDDALSTGDDDDILEEGETWVYTFTEQATQAMINAGTTVINTAYANGDAVGTGAAATQVDDDASLDVCQDPVIQIVKEGTTSDGEDCIDVVGEDIVWTIEVTRAGNVDLENVVVTDDRVDGGATALVRDDALSTGDDDDILEEGETWVYTFTEQATQAMINAGTTVINTAYANGDAVGTGAAATQVDDDASLDVCQDPVIQIVKEGTTSDGEDCIDVVGEDIVWTIEVTRAGNVDLENVVVTDDRVDGGATALVRDDALSTGDDDDILEEGETWVYTFTEQATQAMINAGTTVINTAYANGDAVGTGAAATQVDDDASLDVCQDPVIQIVKEGTTSDGEDCIDVVGEDIVWTIEVTRAGNVDLENVVVTDDRVDGGATALVRDDALSTGDDDDILEEGETWVYTFTEQATQAMINAGTTVINTAYANGDAVGTGAAATQVDDDASLDVCQDPVIQIVKEGTTSDGEDCIDVLGEDIVWTIEVTRAGNVDLENVVVTDDRVDGGATALVRDDALSSGDDDDILEAGETWVYTFTEQATQAMLDAGGTVSNTAFANGDAVGTGDAALEADDDAMLEVCQYPGIDIEKYVSVDSGAGYIPWDDADSPTGPVASLQSDAQFFVTVENTGNITLTGVQLVDTVNPEVGDDYLVDYLANAMVDTDGDNIADLSFAAFDLASDGVADGLFTLNVGQIIGITYDLPFAHGQHENIVVATTDQGVGDSDAAYYYGLVNDGPGVRTPGFWQNPNNGLQFWDGDPAIPHTGDYFPEEDLLYAVDSNNDGEIDELDEAGLLIGDWNRNGLVDDGEDALFIRFDDAVTALRQDETKGFDGGERLARDLTASWLNYLAGNNVEATSSDPGNIENAPSEWIQHGIDWLQRWSGEDDTTYPGAPWKASMEVFDVYDPADRIYAHQWAWKNGLFWDSPKPNDIHEALDSYNNDGSINGYSYAGDVGTEGFMAAVSQIRDAEETAAGLETEKPLVMEDVFAKDGAEPVMVEPVDHGADTIYTDPLLIA